jgi:hypothetical protein
MKLSRRNLIVSLAAAGFFTVASPPALAADDKIDVSQIIDKSVAESVIGEPVKAPAPRNMDGGDGYYSKCNYYSASSGKALVIRLYQAAAGFDPQKELEMVQASTGSAKAVSGLGDQAQVYSGAESGLPANVVMLYVIKGNSLITVGLSGLDEETALEKAKRVAQRIVAQL